MRKSARIDTRTTVEEKQNLKRKAITNRETLSEYARRVLVKSLEVDNTKVNDNILIETTDPLVNEEMLKLIVWINSKRFNYTVQGSVNEAKYYFSILDKHYNNLDSEYQLLFYKIYVDLERVIINLNPYIGVIYNFTSPYSNDRFEYDKFEELLLKVNFT